MKKQIIAILFIFCTISKIEALTYMNGQDILIRTMLTDAYYTPLDYNILNSGDGHLSEHKRFFGIHNMSIAIPGYETVYLIKDDVCLYPELFTLLVRRFYQKTLA